MMGFMMKRANLLMTVFLLLASAMVQAAGTETVAGKVGYMSGTLVAQRADGTVQVLGPKSNVLTGDMLVTAKNSYAQIQMNDGARMTLRPHSNLKIESFHFNKEEPKSDNAVLRLLKGGFRTLTGMIGKRGNADAYKLHAASSTIGIRGTDFSSRLCASKDCADDEAEAAQPQLKAPSHPSQVIGRVMRVQGSMSAKAADGKQRQLLLGAPVYEGDILTTAGTEFEARM